ncbi:MAG: class F sortase [Clostridia bacterium]|nr:class F sortase [Clostridia bacterium]
MENMDNNKQSMPVPPEGQEDDAKREAKRKKRRLISNLLLVASALLFLAGAYSLLQAYVIPPKTDYVAPPTPAPTVAATPAPTIDVAETPAPTPEPTPYNLKPARISFTTLEQVCEIQPVGYVDPQTKEEVEPEDMEPGKSYAMGTVDSNIIAAWFKYGPAPGDRGNAILDGHNRWKNKYGVFNDLIKLQTGDEIVIEMDDGSFTYWYVHEVNKFERESVPPEVMELHWGEEPMLTLITCTGTFDYKVGTHTHRCVVVARMTPPEAQGAQ